MGNHITNYVNIKIIHVVNQGQCPAPHNTLLALWRIAIREYLHMPHGARIEMAIGPDSRSDVQHCCGQCWDNPVDDPDKKHT